MTEKSTFVTTIKSGKIMIPY